MKNATKKDKRRIIVLMLIFIPLLTFFVVNMFGYWSQIFSNMKETEKLKNVYNSKLEEEENLKDEITKLEDDEYVARYAREKYLYSKDGEIIIKID